MPLTKAHRIITIEEPCELDEQGFFALECPCCGNGHKIRFQGEIATPAAAAVGNPPDWIKETPEPTTYNLTMFESDGGSIQDIHLTRDEYITLKTRLATMRGYTDAGK